MLQPRTLPLITNRQNYHAVLPTAGKTVITVRGIVELLTGKQATGLQINVSANIPQRLSESGRIKLMQQGIAEAIERELGMQIHPTKIPVAIFDPKRPRIICIDPLASRGLMGFYSDKKAVRFLDLNVEVPMEDVEWANVTRNAHKKLLEHIGNPVACVSCHLFRIEQEAPLRKMVLKPFKRHLDLD